MKAEQCWQCGRWAEPPFAGVVQWHAPATVDDVPGFTQGEPCETVRIERPLCRYCAHALPHGVDGLTEEGKDARDFFGED